MSYTITPKCDIKGVARCFLRNGFSVIPTCTDSKEPAIKWKEYQEHRMNSELVGELFNSKNNISVITGAISNLTVIDVDDLQLFESFYDFGNLIKSAGIVIKSPKGYHFYFNYDGHLKTSQYREYGFDIKNDGGLVVAPPSSVNGKTYYFIKNDGLRSIPEDFKNKLVNQCDLYENKEENPLLAEILQKLKISKLQNGIYRCYCPAHNDQNPSLDVGMKDGRLYIRCWAGCSREAILNAIGLKGEAKKESEDNTTKRLLQLAENFELWLNQNGDEFATLDVNGTAQNMRIDCREFRKFLQFLYFKKYGKPAHTQAILEAIHTLCGKAYFEGKKFQSYIRIGKHDETLELDLLNGKVVRISKDEISITDGICKFERLTNLLPLPIPNLNIDKEEWRNLAHFINADTEAVFLILAWLIGCFNVGGEFPILNIIGEFEGIGKSTASRFIKSILDPATVSNKPLPRTEDDLLVVCTHNHIVSFDNISTISDSISDALCRIATGSGIAKRKLFTDKDASLFFVKNPLILNGIDLFAERRDLRRRCVHVELQKLTNPKPIQLLERAFTELHPKLLGWLVKAVQLALREDLTEDVELTDMASFVSFICRTEKLFPVKSNEFVELFKTNRSNISVQTVLENPLTQVIMGLSENEWQGTVTELYEIITQKFQNSLIKYQLPKDAKALSRKIRRMLGDLENIGIICEFTRNSRGVFVHIKKLEKISTLSTHLHKPLKINTSCDVDIDVDNVDNKKINKISTLQNSLINKDFDDNVDNVDKFPNFLMCDDIDLEDIQVLE